MEVAKVALIRLFDFMSFAIVVRALLSWFPVPRGSRFARILYQITEPILAPIRDLIQRTSWGRNLMVDLSPIIALLILMMVEGFLADLLQVSAITL